MIYQQVKINLIINYWVSINICVAKHGGQPLFRTMREGRVTKENTKKKGKRWRTGFEWKPANNSREQKKVTVDTDGQRPAH